MPLQPKFVVIADEIAAAVSVEDMLAGQTRGPRVAFPRYAEQSECGCVQSGRRDKYETLFPLLSRRWSSCAT